MEAGVFMTIRSLSASRSYESKSEPKLNIIVADLLPDRLKIIRDCLSVLKKCATLLSAGISKP